MPSLAPIHFADLKSSGLSDTTIEIMQVYSMPPMEITRCFTGKAPSIESALAFPYFDPDGNRNGFLRAKVFPAIDEGGRPIKYLQKSDTPPHLYILPPIAARLKDPAVNLYIVEGEKKTAKAVELGLCAIGIGGLWNWINDDDLIEDFNAILWWRREVVLVPDSDTFDGGKNSELLKQAVYALSRELKKRGSVVKLKVVGNG
jgi:hypothetical protein